MSGTSAVDAFTIKSPALIEARDAQRIVRQHLAHDRGEPWQRGVDVVRDGELAEQLQRAVEICALKVRTVGSGFSITSIAIALPVFGDSGRPRRRPQPPFGRIHALINRRWGD